MVTSDGSSTGYASIISFINSVGSSSALSLISKVILISLNFSTNAILSYSTMHFGA